MHGRPELERGVERVVAVEAVRRQHLDHRGGRGAGGVGELRVVPAQLSDQAALQGLARLVVDEVYSPAAVDARL